MARHNPVAARKAKITKRLNYKAAAAKRTPTAQMLKKKGVGFEVSGPSHVEPKIEIDASNITVTISHHKTGKKIRESKRRARKARKTAFISPHATSMRHIENFPGTLKEREALVKHKVIGDKERIDLGHGVLSTAIDEFAYNDAEYILYIRFWLNWKDRTTSKIMYAYFGVPLQVYEGLLKASSIGKYFNIYIKGRYSFKRI